MTKENIKGLAHLGIYTNDLQVSKEFYMNHFGFQCVFETEVNKSYGTLKISMLQLNQLIIELLKPSIEIDLSHRGSLDHFAIEVKNINDVVKHLKSQGVEFLMDEPNHIKEIFDGISMIFIKGPNGERIELFEYLK